MMKKIFSCLRVFMILVCFIAGCRSIDPTKQPTRSVQLSTPGFIASSPTYTLPGPTPASASTSTPVPTPFMTPTQFTTLEPEKAIETIKTFFSEPEGCSSPCFLGIVPGQTTLGEAENIFRYLSLPMRSYIYEGDSYSVIDYDLDSGLSIYTTFSIEDEIIKDIEIKITPEKQKTGVAREWLAYSPETLIKQFGTPSRVEIIADWGPRPYFVMQLVYEASDFIVQYFGADIIPRQRGSSQICPLTDQFEGIWLWIGKNPQYPPGEGVPLEKVTSLTVDEFTALMTGNADQACFIFDGNLFPDKW